MTPAVFLNRFGECWANKEMSSELAIMGTQIFPQTLDSVTKVDIKRSTVLLHAPLRLLRSITGKFRRRAHNQSSVASLTNSLLEMERDEIDG
jgi:hypothetical protein